MRKQKKRHRVSKLGQNEGRKTGQCNTVSEQMGCGRRARMIKAVEGRRMPVGRQCSNLLIYHCLGDRRYAYKQLSPSTLCDFPHNACTFCRLRYIYYMTTSSFLRSIKRNGAVSKYCNRAWLVPCNQFTSPCDHRPKVCSYFLNIFRVVNPIFLNVEQIAGISPFSCDCSSAVDLAQSSRRYSRFLIRVRIFLAL